MRAAALILVAATTAHAGLFGRDAVSARWTDAALPVNGDDAGWQDAPAFEDEGVSVQAMNDGTDVYFLITARTREVDDLIDGEAHQDLELRFYRADGKSPAWGARLPFSRRESLMHALRDPAGLDPQPELVLYDGASVSSAAWPSDMADRMAAVGRRPIWEIKVPLARLHVDAERTLPFDFVVAAPAGAARTRPEPTPEASKPEGKRGRHEPERAREAWAPGAATYGLRLRLARSPDETR